VKACKPGRLERPMATGTCVAQTSWRGGTVMLMFKRTQLYIGFALAALAEIIVRYGLR